MFGSINIKFNGVWLFLQLIFVGLRTLFDAEIAILCASVFCPGAITIRNCMDNVFSTHTLPSTQTFLPLLHSGGIFSPARKRQSTINFPFIFWWDILPSSKAPDKILVGVFVQNDFICMNASLFIVEIHMQRLLVSLAPFDNLINLVL